MDETPFLVPQQKEFYRIMLKERKERILDYSMERLLAQEAVPDTVFVDFDFA